MYGKKVVVDGTRPTYRVLALHGKGGSGEEFAKRVKPLIDALDNEELSQWQWSFPTAPHDNAWWTLPPGVRSFNAESFDGIDESIQALEELCEREGPFDAILGHSQGAMLTAVLLARGLMGEMGEGPGTSIAPQCAIMTGAAWPNPYSQMISDMVGAETLLPPTLHCIGEKDTMNPPEQAAKLAHCFRGQVWDHDGGHVVPLGEGDLERLSGFLVGHCRPEKQSPPPTSQGQSW